MSFRNLSPGQGYRYMLPHLIFKWMLGPHACTRACYQLSHLSSHQQDFRDVCEKAKLCLGCLRHHSELYKEKERRVFDNWPCKHSSEEGVWCIWLWSNTMISWPPPPASQLLSDELYPHFGHSRGWLPYASALSLGCTVLGAPRMLLVTALGTRS